MIQSPRGIIVYTIDAQNKAVARPVEIVYASGLDAAVTGVQPGERIVVDGRQNLRPGVAVVERAASGPGGGSARGAGGAASGASAPMEGASATMARASGAAAAATP